MAAIQFIPHDTKVDFVKFRHIAFAVSLIAIIGSILLFTFKGLNYGIDFRGGVVMEVRTPETPDIGAMRDKLNTLELGEVAIQEFGGANDLLIRLEKQKGGDGAETKALQKIKDVLGDSVEYRRVETVGPKVSQELMSNGITAVVLALIAMLIYIAVRFEWQFGVCAVIALAHDCVAILGVYALAQLEFTETAIIAILITAGYSINDTIVIFDRIRENIRKYKKATFGEIINRSINTTLSRTILTVTTTLLALLALYFFGGQVIATFTLPIIIGVAFGTFSSICVASPLLMYLGVKMTKDKKEEIASTGA